MTTLTFQNTALAVINQKNQIWMTVTEIGKALGYSDPFKSVKNIYDRHQDEFTEKMTALIDMPTAGGLQKVRIFSLRGCHLIGMLSHTKVAKDFRRWVLDILDKEANQPQQLALPDEQLPLAYRKKKYTRELTEKQWLCFASLWFALYNNLELLEKIHKPLELLNSRYGVTAYTHATEYSITLGITKRILDPLLAEFNVDQREEPHYHLALKTLREYQPKGIGRVARI